MRFRAILREAGRDIASGTARSVHFALLLSIATVGLLAADLSTVQGITRSAAEFRESGASVLTISAPGRVDGAACEALEHLPTVRAAGAMRVSEDGFVSAALPSSAIPLAEVSERFLDVVRSDTVAAPGVIVSEQVAEALTVGQGDDLVGSNGSVPIRGVYSYPDDGRRPGLGYAVLSPVTSERAFDECWVDSWPMADEIPALMQTALLPADGADDKPTVSQLNTRLGRGFDGAARFDERITRYALPALIGIAATIGYLSVRLRRVELASDLHAGARKRDLAAIQGIEIAAWTSAAILFAATAAALFARLGSPEDESSIYVLSLRLITAAALSPFLGGAVALAVTKERHLFRYFKDR